MDCNENAISFSLQIEINIILVHEIISYVMKCFELFMKMKPNAFYISFHS